MKFLTSALLTAALTSFALPAQNTIADIVVAASGGATAGQFDSNNQDFDILLTALKTQDQFLAGFVLMFVALLTLIGTMISDVLLVLLDPRIRYEGREQ